MSNALSANKRGPLNKARIASLKPRIDKETGKKKPVDAFDAVSKSAVPGLLVRCQPSGKKYYYYQHRRPAFVKNRKTGAEVLNKNASTRICLGLSEDITIATARERARTVRDAAKAAVRAGLTGDNVTKRVHTALNNLDESVEALEARQEAKRICPTAEEFIDTDYAEEKKSDKLKSFQDGREIQRLKHLLSVLSQPPKKGRNKGQKGDPQFNLLTMKLDEIDFMLIKKWRMARQKRVSDRTQQATVGCHGIARTHDDAHYVWEGNRVSLHQEKPARWKRAQSGIRTRSTTAGRKTGTTITAGIN